MATIIIDDVEVDTAKPCEVVTALRGVELKIVCGAGVAMTRFGDDEVRWSTANLEGLRSVIAQYERLCFAASGRRYRHAKRMRFIR